MFISKKKLNKLINVAKNEGYESGYKDGYSKGNKKGYSKGLHEGLTRDKKGVLYTHNGLYAFEDGVTKEAIRDYVNEQKCH